MRRYQEQNGAPMNTTESDVKRDVKDTARQVGDAAQRVGAAAEEKIGSMMDAAQESLVGAIKPARDRVQSFAQRQKSLGAQQIDSVARAAQRVAQEVEDEMPGVARSVRSAAGRLDAASSSLRDQSVEELLQNVGDLARKRPAAFFGGAVLAGFALSRFLKASAANR